MSQTPWLGVTITLACEAVWMRGLVSSVRRCPYSATVLNLRRIQHSTHHFGHVRENIDSEMCHIDIVVEFSFANLHNSIIE